MIFNGDGLNDIAVAVTMVFDYDQDGGQNPTVFDSEGVYILFGSTDAAEDGGWNHKLNSQRSIELESQHDVVIDTSHFTGASSIASVGNVNGDAADGTNHSLDDLAIGDDGRFSGGSDPGRVYLFYGREEWNTASFDDDPDGVASVDFNNNLGTRVDADGFTVESGGINLWHLSEERGGQPGHSPLWSWYFADETDPEGLKDYVPPHPNQGNQVAGTLISPAFTITSGLGGSAQFELRFNHFLSTHPESERDSDLLEDLATVRIREKIGLVWAEEAVVLAANTDAAMRADIGTSIENVPEALNESPSAWASVALRLNLTALGIEAGTTVRFEFDFDSGNGDNNNAPGWQIDDVTVARVYTAMEGEDGVSVLSFDNTGYRFGAQLVGVGDFSAAQEENGSESVDDFAVLGHRVDDNLTDRSLVYVVLGRDANPADIQADLPFPAESPIDSPAVLRMVSETTLEGFRLAGVGDINPTEGTRFFRLGAVWPNTNLPCLGSPAVRIISRAAGQCGCGTGD